MDIDTLTGILERRLLALDGVAELNTGTDRIEVVFDDGRGILIEFSEMGS